MVNFNKLRGYEKMRHLKLWLVAMVFLFPMSVFAIDVTLDWDGIPPTGLAGYKVHYGPSPGTYDTVVDVGMPTTYQVTGLSEGSTYYFAVTAYGDPGYLESDFSNEVQVDTPLTLQAPANVSVSVTWIFGP